VHFSSTGSNPLPLGVTSEENYSMERNSLEQSNNKQSRSLQLPANTVISGFRSELRSFGLLSSK
jgi:hypothetical protein